MIRIQRLNRATRRSGHELKPLATTKMKGMTITNTNNFSVYVDKFQRKPARKKK